MTQHLDSIRLDFKQRLLLAVVLLIVSVVYLPLNRVMQGGTTVEIWLDQYVPLWPIWMVPYLLAIVWWFVAGTWAFLAMEDRLFVAFVSSWILACLIGYCFFILYPTYMVRPAVTTDGWAASLVQHVYTNDRTYNAFPSMHLWVSVTITLYMGRWKPKWRVLLWAATIVVALSTLFTGQHWILDVVGGTLLAVLCYYLGPAIAAWVIARRSHRSPAIGRSPESESS
jgi:membrane-associated phospholipid phosphatase